MNRNTVSATFATIAVIGTAWLTVAAAQTSSEKSKPEARASTTITATPKPLKSDQPEARASTTITAQPTRLDLETRVAILERQVAQLREQVQQLVAQNSAAELRYIGPQRGTVTPASKTDGSVPRLRESAASKEK
jgi:hypothetical protein